MCVDTTISKIKRCVKWPKNNSIFDHFELLQMDHYSEAIQRGGSEGKNEVG